MKLSKLIALTIVLGLLILFIISFLAGFDRIFLVLSQANYWFILIAVFYQALSVVALFLRWDIIVRHCRLKISGARLFMITLAGIAFSHLMPSSRMGGEPVRAYFLAKETKRSTSLCLSSIIVERIFDAMTFSIISLIVLVPIVLFWNLPAWIISLLVIAFAIALFMLFLLVYISINRKVGMRIVFWFFRRFKRFLSRWKKITLLEKKLEKEVSLYTVNVSSMLRKKHLWAFGFSFSILVWVFDIFRTYFIFLALGSNVSLLVIAGAVIIASLAGAIPISPGGLGLIEAAMIVVFTSAGVPIAIAGMVTIIDRLISYWGLTFIGLVPSYYLGIQKYSARK
jgi:hypothetical protein